MRSRSPESPYLLIPGPTEVHPEVAAAATRPMIGHRGPEIRRLMSELTPRLQSVLETEADVYPLGCSATGAMEAAVRNAAPGPFLHLVCGAFSRRWSQIRESCGLEGEDLEVEWGRAVRPESVREKLEGGRFAAVTLVHSETSTGVLNPLAEIAAVVREHPDTLLLVDTVSSMSAVPLALQEWGVDVCLAGVQKAWALPAGLTITAVSERALERSRTATVKGTYLDWWKHHEALRKWQTPSTPPISLMMQLRVQLERIESEGLSARYERHLALQAEVAAWAEGRLEIFPEEGYRSPTLTPLDVAGRSVPTLQEGMLDRGWRLGAGYGPTRDRLVRIGHMGEMDLTTLRAALADLDEVMAETDRRREQKG